MKLGELTSFGHNIADSVASGMCFMLGTYFIDIFGEAAASPEGHVLVDFVAGTTSGSPVSEGLSRAIQRCSELLPELAKKHGLDASEIRTLQARFGTDPVAGPHFRVTVESSDGRRSEDQYAGIPGKRFSKARRSRGAA
jgi:hypothetical protein